MTNLFIERRTIKRETAYCVMSGGTVLGACLTLEGAQELLDASLLASTAILNQFSFPLTKPSAPKWSELLP